MHIHICTVSDQILPNLIPALMDRPDQVVLLASERMREQAHHLRRVLKDYHIDV